MGLTFEIDGSAVSDRVRFAEWDLTEYAYRGQVGTGVLVMVDDTASYLPPAQKSLEVVNIVSGSNSLLFSGFLAERTAEKGRAAPGGRQWSVTIEDINARLDDRIITDAMQGTKKREAETDRQRILWLLSLGAMTGITAGYVPTGDNVDMDAIDYRGKKPRDVLEDCAQAAGKNFYLYSNAPGDVRLWYAKSDAEESPGLPLYRSSVTITDDASAVNSTTHFAPYGVRLSLDPSRVYSRVRIRYKGGASTTAQNNTTASTYRVREIYRRYMRAKTAAKAQSLAQGWLTRASEEQATISLSVNFPAAYVNEVRAGHALKLELSRYDINAYYRVIRRTIRQVTDELYALDLDFEDKVRPTALQGPAIENPDAEEMSNGTDTDQSVVIDSDGIAVVGGAISVTNGNGTVIIDGSSDFFSIVASGTLTLPRTSLKGQTYQSISVTTGIAYDPASMFFAKTASKDGKGNWAQPLPEMALSASGTILRMVTGRARHVENTAGTSAKTQVQVMRFTSSPPEDAITVRYYVLQKTAI